MPAKPSITEVSEQLSQFSVINGTLLRAAEFERFCRGEPRNFAIWRFATFSVETVDPVVTIY